MTDAFMRAAENERQTLQVGSLSILAPPADGEAPVTRQVLRDLVARRIHLAPALCRKLLRVPLGLDTLTGSTMPFATSITTCGTWH